MLESLSRVNIPNTVSCQTISLLLSQETETSACNQRLCPYVEEFFVSSVECLVDNVLFVYISPLSKLFFMSYALSKHYSS